MRQIQKILGSSRILDQKEKSEKQQLSNFKIYYDAIITKTELYGHKRLMEQNRELINKYTILGSPDFEQISQADPARERHSFRQETFGKLDNPL